jgi:hypothetical protein
MFSHTSHQQTSSNHTFTSIFNVNVKEFHLKKHLLLRRTCTRQVGMGQFAKILLFGQISVEGAPVLYVKVLNFMELS